MNEIIQMPIIEDVEQGFLDYSMSVITDRAIPSAEDGFKPVARRILYTMFEDGMSNNKKFHKCAVPVADTMGRYHPHGDSSIYGALCALSQPWTMRYPVITFHGNNGSRDNDSPASYRYTECKLSKYGEFSVGEIKKNCVDWVPNYTEDKQEPVYLGGLFPNLLCNGGSGIAVGMASSFAPHNLNEVIDAAVHTLSNSDCTIDELLNYITGPDFPTGGLIINKDELPSAYKTGKGRARIRAEYEIEEKKCHKTKIIFTSIPYKVSKEDLIIVIDQLCEEKKINGITAIRDESNMEGVRFVIEVAKDVDPHSIINKLFKFTNLETTYSFNQVALVDKKPKLCNLKDLIDVYIAHQKDIQKRKSQFEYDKIQARLNILKGLLIALEDIDNVIQLIKNSENSASAKIMLMGKYKLNDEQAKAILDMKLSKLAKLEKIELLNEQKELVDKSQYFNNIITNEKFANEELSKELIQFKEQYGDVRRSTITQINTSPEEKEIEFVEPEKCVVVLTEAGNVKRIPATSFRTQKRNTKGIKTQDDITSTTIRTNTIDSLMVFTNKGKMYRLLVNEIPVGTNSSKGVSIKSLIEMESNEEPQIIYSIYRETDAKYVMFITKNGTVKKTALDEYINVKRKTGITAIKLRDGDSLAAVTLIKEEPIIILTKNGYGLKLNSAEISPTARATIGVKGINLGDNDTVIAVLPIRNSNDYLALFAENGQGLKIKLNNIQEQTRGSKGLVYYKQHYLAGATLVDDNDNVLVVGDKTSVCIQAKTIPVLNRGSSGNIIIKDNNIMSVTKV